MGSNWSLHDLRHTAAYRMARDPQMLLTDVQSVLGHAHQSTTQRYLNPVTQLLRSHGVLGEDAPAAIEMFSGRGQPSCKQLIDRYPDRLPAGAPGAG